ncbi:MAG: hypothetical protein HLUCCA12_02115 [Rhodobacteraceae bacterium HLUCCA12]|nr:MAG: hypothetical protein HLUCCA12_02115 [Rhodobacteraceae bacterium HLUCCA12]
MRTARFLAVLALVSGALAYPASAQVLDALEGRWQGTGQLSLDDEAEQRLQCRLRIRGVDAGRSVFSGRCATAQASRSFVYLLSVEAGVVVEAENRSEPPDDLPGRMRGTVDRDILRFEEPGEALFELRLTGGGLVFRLEGDGPEGFARGQARLQRIGADAP